MASLVSIDAWWQDRRVFVTGHTGFMGGWLCTYLIAKGARVYGYSLEPNTTPSFFHNTTLDKNMALSTIGDVCDLPALVASMSTAKPEVIFHLAAQPLVLTAHAHPVDTFKTNVMGTVNVMEAARNVTSVNAMLLVTTDKVYQNNNWHWPYRENDPIGGNEPYSASKAASEHVIRAYRNSYLPNLGVATLRVGNIIGGGDWAANRLFPDAVRHFSNGTPLTLRNPLSTRPWQHVLDPLPGYLTLARRLVDHGRLFQGEWNFGPASSDSQQVETVARALAKEWGQGATVETEETATIFEEKLLSLDSSKANVELGWQPRWPLSDALAALAAWYKAFENGDDMWAFTKTQIREFDNAGPEHVE